MGDFSSHRVSDEQINDRIDELFKSYKSVLMKKTQDIKKYQKALDDFGSSVYIENTLQRSQIHDLLKKFKEQKGRILLYLELLEYVRDMKEGKFFNYMLLMIFLEDKMSNFDEMETEMFLNRLVEERSFYKEEEEKHALKNKKFKFMDIFPMIPFLSK